MKEETIKLKEIKEESKEKEVLPENPEVQLNEFYNRKLSPIDLGIVNRSAKLNKRFIVNGSFSKMGSDAATTPIGSSSITTIVSNNANEADLGYVNFDANELRKFMFIRLTANGVFGTVNGVDTVALAVNMIDSAGTTVYHTLTSAAALVTAKTWALECLIGINAVGATGTALSYFDGFMNWTAINTVSAELKESVSQTINTTISQKLSLTANWTAADAANTITIRNFLVEIIN